MKKFDLTFAIGDVHGCLEKLLGLRVECQAYAAGRTYGFVFLGDYIDRGPDSAGVVHYLRDSQSHYPDRFICLRGNHEAMLIETVDDPTATDDWLRNGGLATLTSYGSAKVAGIPRDDIDWMRRLPLFHGDGRRFFVHAGIDPTVPLNQQTDATMLWTRKHDWGGVDPGRLIVHGHTPVREPDLQEHRLNIDTAAAYGNVLTAAVFDDKQVRPLAFITHAGHVTQLDKDPQP